MNNDMDTIDQLNAAFSNVNYHRNVADFTPRPSRIRKKRRKATFTTATCYYSLGHRTRHQGDCACVRPAGHDGPHQCSAEAVRP